MVSHLLLTAAAGGGALLFAAGGVHALRHPAALRAALLRQAILPPALARLVAALVPFAELAAALAFVLALLVPPWRVALLAVFTMLAAVYTGYLLAVRARGSGAGCGCLGSSQPVNALHVLRVGTIAAAGALLALTSPVALTPVGALIVAALSAFCAGLYWIAPLAQPV